MLSDDEELIAVPQHNVNTAVASADAIAQARLLDPLSTAAATAALLSSSSCDTPDLYKNRSNSNSPKGGAQSSSPLASLNHNNGASSRNTTRQAQAATATAKSSEGSELNTSHFTISVSAPQEDAADHRVRTDGEDCAHSSLPFLNDTTATRAAPSTNDSHHSSAVAQSTPPSILLVEVDAPELYAIAGSKAILSPAEEEHTNAISGGTPNVPTASSTQPIHTNRDTKTTSSAVQQLRHSDESFMLGEETKKEAAQQQNNSDEHFSTNLTAAASAGGGARIPPEQLRLLLLDQADREAVVYADDHNARRRLAVLQRSILDHNERVRRNVRAFFLSAAGDAATLPSTQPFTEVRIPQRFIDPVTKRLISDPVIFADKRIMDRPSAEALAFRLFSTMLRCQTLGANKRQEYFMYCFDNVLVSSIAKQWRRQAFGFRGLELTPRPDIAASIREWIALQMSLCVDLRESIEREIQNELGITEVPFSASGGSDGAAAAVDGKTSPTNHVSDGNGYNIGSTMMFLRDSSIFGGGGATTNSFGGSSGVMLNASNGGTMDSSSSQAMMSSMDDANTMELRDMLKQVIVSRKVPKEWDTLEHMWRDLCASAIRWRKRRKKKRSASAVSSLIRRSLDVMRKLSASVSPSPSPSRRGTRHSSFAQPAQQLSADSQQNPPQQQQQRSRQTSVGGCRSPSVSHDASQAPTSPSTHLYRQTSPSIMLTASHYLAQHTTVPTSHAAAAASGGDGATDLQYLSLGVEIAGSTSFDVAEHIALVEIEETSARIALRDEEESEEADLVAVREQLKVAAAFELRTSTAAAPQLLGAPGGRRRVSLASSSGRPISTTLTSPLASPLIPSTPGAVGVTTTGHHASPRYPTAAHPQSAKHHVVRHKVAVEAGANHRTPHRVVLKDVVGTMVVSRPAACSAALDAARHATSDLTEDVQLTTVAPDGTATTATPAVVIPTPPVSAQQSPLRNTSSESHFVNEPFDLVSSLDSLTGLVASMLTSSVGRAQRSAAPPLKRGDNPNMCMLTEEVALVSATMRLHQDRELLNSAFEFSEKWFTDMEERCMKWATEQFTMMAEQQAKERAMGSKQQQLLRSRAVLTPRQCVVSGGGGGGGGEKSTDAKNKAPLLVNPMHSPRSETSLRHNKSPPITRPRPPTTSTRSLKKGTTASPVPPVVPAALRSGEASSVGLPVEEEELLPEYDDDEKMMAVNASTDIPTNVVPNDAWRQRVAETHKKRLNSAASGVPPLGQVIPPSLQFLVPAAVPVGITTTTTCGGGGIVLKPPWASELERIRNKPSKSSNYVQSDALRSTVGGGSSEIPSHELQKELQDLYMQFDLNTMQEEVLRKRELGPYYFEPLVFEDEVAQKNAARHSAVFSKLSHITVPELDLHWNRPTVTTLFGYDAGGDGSGQRRAMIAHHSSDTAAAQPATPQTATTTMSSIHQWHAATSPRLALPLAGGGFDATERVPIRPHSSSVGARSWAASTNYAVQSCGQDSKLGGGALLAATLLRRGSSGLSASSRNSATGVRPARPVAEPSSSLPSSPAGKHRREPSGGSVRPPTSGRPPTTGRRTTAAPTIDLPDATPNSARLPRIPSTGGSKKPLA